jgi:hypothetical protein
VLILKWTKACISVCQLLGVLSGSLASCRPSGLVWSGDDGFVLGTWSPPSFIEKLFSAEMVSR